MKFKLVATLVLLVILGGLYFVMQDNNTPQSAPSDSDSGIVLH